ncbi:hypothetical protein [Streptomyces violascens]|uniref:hypothetical protein n=1 Tax=Streptomyces violascens TaxID=67381 RepID=UPI0016788E3D|nr:hypothetical protein [Streptomyces violascens]GGU38858.1 hypothetical protein GCM10010289_69670 [Streptomyces violascens]
MTAPEARPPSFEAYSAAMAQALKDCDLGRYRRLFSARSAAAQAEADERLRRALGGS